MPVNPGDLVQLSWRGKCFGQNIIMVRNYRVTGSAGSTQPTGQTLAQIIDTVEVGGPNAITVAYLACLQANYTLEEIRAQVVRPDRSAFVARTYNGVAGTGGGGVVSNQQGAITLRTANAGRNQVSTVKVGPLPTAFAAAGELSAAGRIALNSLRDFLVAIFDVDPPGIVLSPIIWHSPGLTYDALINGAVQPQARVMVRRTLGRGE